MTPAFDYLGLVLWCHRDKCRGWAMGLATRGMSDSVSANAVGIVGESLTLLLFTFSSVMSCLRESMVIMLENVVMWIE